jgi:lysophospholipase L1-like esterase
MKYFYIYILALLCFIVAMSYWNSHGIHLVEGFFLLEGFFPVEGFNSRKQQFLLLGDSILKNDLYVANGKSVDALLRAATDGKTTCLAVNEATIPDVYLQINKIPESLKSFSNSVKTYKNTTIFLSIGGNDILTQYGAKGNTNDLKILDTIFTQYKKLVKSIQTAMPNAVIVLLDLYYPDNIKFRIYHKIIRRWNEKLVTYARENRLNIFQISQLLTRPEDFTLSIEPSAIGSEKLVNAMIKNY